MQNRTLALAGGVIFLTSIVAANMMTARYGMVGVGFGLTATAGTYAAGAAFIARDVMHSGVRHPRLVTLAVTALGAVLAYWLSTPALAIASGVAFAVSETLDLLVFERARRAGWIAASASSNTVGAVVDTLVFVPLAGFILTWDVAAGQVVGKLTLTGAAVICLLLIRGARRRAVPV